MGIMDTTGIISNIRAEMARRGKSQGDVAELLGVTRQAVSRRFTGQVELSVGELLAIAEYLDVPAAVLLT